MTVDNLRGLRVLWLSPWMRPLARIYAESLLDAGVDVMLITSDQHPSTDIPRAYEIVLDPRPKTARTWPQFARARSSARLFSPDVVVTELVRDPRWMTFAPGVPRVELIHDDQPHDAGEERPRWERILFGQWSKRSTCTVAFSDYVARAIGADAMVPLTSDLEETHVHEVVPAESRRDFILLGRLNAYKNIDVCLEAWQDHTSGNRWRGDNLMLLGEGEWRRSLPDHVVWLPHQFQYADVVPMLARAKASIVHYRRASQSGVQLLSMQLGVTPIVSTEGALPEFQPPSEMPIGVDDVAALASAFDSLADPLQAAARGAVARQHYLRGHCATDSAQALLQILSKASQGIDRKDS